MIEMLKMVLCGVLIGGIYALAAAGLGLQYSVIKIMNLAHGEFILIGTYLFYLMLDINPSLAILLSPTILLMLGFLLQNLLFNPKRIVKIRAYTVIVTFALSLILQNTLLLIFKADIRGVHIFLSSINFLGIELPLSRIIAFTLALSILITLSLFLNKTYLGNAILAVAEDYEAGELVGINSNRIYALSFGASLAITGASGVAISLIYPFSPFSGGSFLLKSFVVIVLSGLNVGYIILSGVILGIAEFFCAYYISMFYADLLVYIFFLTILILRAYARR